MLIVKETDVYNAKHEKFWTLEKMDVRNLNAQIDKYTRQGFKQQHVKIVMNTKELKATINFVVQTNVQHLQREESWNEMEHVTDAQILPSFKMVFVLHQFVQKYTHLLWDTISQKKEFALRNRRYVLLLANMRMIRVYVIHVVTFLF